MTSQEPSDRWYYARDKKKLGPVALADLCHLLAKAVLKPADMVLQEGTKRWRPLAEVVPPARGRKMQVVLAVGAGLFLLALCSWGLLGLLGRPNQAGDGGQPFAETQRSPGLAKAKAPEASKEILPAKAKEPSPLAFPAPLETALPREELSPVNLESGVPTRLVIQVGHSSYIESLAMSGDGTLAASGGWDGVIVWDVRSGKEVRRFRVDPPARNTVAFSGDGKLLAVGCNDQQNRPRMAIVWDVPSGKQIQSFKGHASGVSAVALSADGKWLATGSWDQTARVWDVVSGKEVHCCRHATRGSVALSGDGKWLATGSLDNTARLWDARTGKETQSFKGQLVALSHDGKRLATATGNNMLGLWDAISGKELCSFQGSFGAMSADGKRLATVVDGAACVWDTTTGKEIRRVRRSLLNLSDETDFQKINPGSDAIIAMALSLDGKRLATVCTYFTPSLWDVDSGQEILRFRGHARTIFSLKLSGNGRWLVTTGQDFEAPQSSGVNIKGRLWDVAAGKEISRVREPAWKYFLPQLRRFALSWDGKWVATASPDNTARLWEVSTGKVVQHFRGHSKAVGALAFSRDGKWLATASLDKTVRLWETNFDKELRQFRGHTDYVRSIAFSDDGKWLATGGRDNTARLWEVSTGQEKQRIRAHDQLGFFQWIQNVAVSENGKLLATSYWSVKGNTGNGQLENTLMTKTAHLWDMASGKEIQWFRGHDGYIDSLTLSADGKRLATASFDRTVRLWDTTSGKELRVIEGNSVAMSRDGKWLFTGSRDHSVRVWDTASGKELCRLFTCRQGGGVAATPDNYYTASKGALEAVAFGVGKRVFSFDQFDLKFNRPDKVQESIGLASKEMIGAYRHAYQKRLKRMNFTEDMLSGDFHVPEIAVNAGKMFVTSEKTLKMKVQANDSRYLLDRLYVDINGVSVHGTGGISLRKQASKTWAQEIEVELSAGKNQIEVSVLNEKGAESLKETVSIQYDAPASKPNLYVVAVGISDYQDARFRLTYADKDARDLADLFESKRDRFGAVKLLRILNHEATRENILKVRDFLKSSQVDDLVVLFFAGHGLLDSNLDYYFGTADVDFKNPAKRGLPYEAIEDLLDGIRARKKLLLMDTCHSGELDKEDIQVARSEKQPEGEIKIRGFRGLDLDIAPKVGLANSYQLLQEMFADLRRGTGAVIISSAGGAEYALESAAWKNGVFTHALLRGLKGEADRNKDGRVQVSELRDFVEQEVRRLTHGRQAPTARRENLVVDFMLD